MPRVPKVTSAAPRTKRFTPKQLGEIFAAAKEKADKLYEEAQKAAVAFNKRPESRLGM